MPVAAVRMEGVFKSFPGVLANNDITLEVEQGEIHALLGENGAGKTTLMNILYGLYRAEAGQIYLQGEPVEIASPKQAIEYGINMVHQHFMLVPVFSVAENIILGLETPREPLLDLRQAKRRIKELSESYGLSVEPEAKVWQLSVGAQQRVEIIKALYRGTKVLILDEPTAVLTPGEIDDLFTVLRQLAEQGKTVIFITHKLREVMEISDRVTVLRDGNVIGNVKTEQTDERSLARMMVGRDVFLELDKPTASPGEVVLETRDIRAIGDQEVPALKGVSINVRAGEILGIAGVDGNGQTELAEAIMGLRAIGSGEVCIRQQIVNGWTTREIIDMGVALIPPDRRVMGLVEDFSISENLLLKRWRQSPFTRHFLFDFGAIRRYSQSMIEEYDIRAPGQQVRVQNLSGGNQQKVVLARELSREPELLVALQPTRGLDVAATEYVRRRLLEERGRGAAVLLISTELDEIMSLSDRIAVLFEGEIMGEVTGERADINEIGLMMAGIRRGDTLTQT